MATTKKAKRSGGSTRSNDPDAPWGRKKDGTPRKKPGVKKGTVRNPMTRKRRHNTNPTEKRGNKSRVDRGGLKADGTPMPATHDSKGRITKEGASILGKMGGRPKGSFSMDRIIREELQKEYGKDGVTAAQKLVCELVKQAIRSGMMRSTITRFLTERVDGKAVQPIKDVTPGQRLAHLDDALLDRLLGNKTLKPDVVPEGNKDDAPSSPTDGQEPDSSQPAPAPSGRDEDDDS